ncbi:hypothetical protein ACLKA6_009156 [Drosophila palustris]
MGVARLSLMLLLAALLQLHHVNAYSKYGRGCGDIGCLPTEECVITSDSCSYNQRDGKECGSYPTCKRKSGSSSNQANPPSAPQSSSGGHGGSQNGGSQNGVGSQNGANGDNGGSNVGAAGASSTGIDPHYVFGAKHHMPIIPNMPIFPYNSPTSAPSFQQFPQPNHPGSVLNPGYPMHGLQPVNPYNPPFVFGQLPFYSGPAGTGGPPGGGGGGVGGGAGVGMPSSSMGILGGGGGGLAPYGSNYQGYQTHQNQNANMYNKPPPQYQNQNQQNPYNRQTQAHPSAAGQLGGGNSGRNARLVCLLAVLVLLASSNRGST